MGIKDQITEEQWKKLFNSISAASSYLALASGGGFEMFKEALSAGKFNTELSKKSGGSGYGKLVDDILAEMKDMSLSDVQDDVYKMQSKDQDSLRKEVKSIIAEGAAVAAELPEGDGFKRWLVDLAEEVAETKTGGILGIGGTSVIDEQEQAALNELKELLGI